ncbi:MAG: hypothetical protein QNJ73_00630 [Gammaproteobacteria bacterium]|nr:hypothetical protein [Gammaproteobacteria bacterium]
MTAYGKVNLVGMFMLPAAAVLAAMIVFPIRGDTLLAVAAMNALPMLIAGLISGLLLRGANRAGVGHLIALWPTLIPAATGVVWYLWRAVLPEAVAPGREYLAIPQYMLLAVLGLGCVAWIGCRVARARLAAA